MIKGKSWMAIVIALMLLTVHLTSSVQTVHAAGEETKIAATLFVLKNELKYPMPKSIGHLSRERLHTNCTDPRTMHLIHYYRP
ncbi:hypothetical protein Q0F98_37185 [Paenibacillus amylolyticus]|nr:hypothetical protein Q0F98_37185 [Paenibacillus amylolyticus]